MQKLPLMQRQLLLFKIQYYIIVINFRSQSPLACKSCKASVQQRLRSLALGPVMQAQVSYLLPIVANMGISLLSLNLLQLTAYLTKHTMPHFNPRHLPGSLYEFYFINKQQYIFEMEMHGLFFGDRSRRHLAILQCLFVTEPIIF